MRPTLARRRAALRAALVGIAVAGCAASPHEFLEPSDERRPDGVAIDLLTAPPRVEARAESSDSVVALRTPLGIPHARRTVREYFEAMASDDSGKLSTLLAPDAMFSSPGPQGSQGAYGALLRRLQVSDYSGLRDTPYWEEAKILEGDEAAAHLAQLAGQATGPRGRARRQAPRVSGPVDVVVVADIVVRRTAVTTLFGEQVALALVAEGDRYVIAQIFEDYAPPR